MTGLLEALGLSNRSVDVQQIFAQEDEAECESALNKIEELLNADAFTPPAIDPRAFVQEGFEKLCRAIEELEN